MHKVAKKTRLLSKKKGLLFRTYYNQICFVCQVNMVMKGDYVKRLPAYAFIAYEPTDAANSTGAVVYYADSVIELANRMHISRSYIYEAIKAQEHGETYRRIPYDIRRVSLN